jgi:hypothetical protein
MFGVTAVQVNDHGFTGRLSQVRLGVVLDKQPRVPLTSYMHQSPPLFTLCTFLSRVYRERGSRTWLNAYVAHLLVPSFTLWPWKFVPYTRQSCFFSTFASTRLKIKQIRFSHTRVGSRFKILPRLRCSHRAWSTLASTKRVAHVPCKPGFNRLKPNGTYMYQLFNGQ